VAWTNGIFLRKLKSKSDSHFGVKRNFGPKIGDNQSELVRMCTCLKCIPKGWLVVVANAKSHDLVRILYSHILGFRFSQSLSIASHTLINIHLVRFDCYDQSTRLGKESCQVTYVKIRLGLSFS